jgi:VWFA-related protein
VDGKPAEITNFYALGGATAGQGAAAPKAAAGAPAAAGAAPAALAADTPKRERLSLVVFVDNVNTRPFDRNRVVKQLRPFIEKTLGPDDQLLIVTHDLGLHVSHPFHESLSALGPELDKLEKDSGLGLTQDIETEQTLEQIKSLGCSRIDEANSIAQAHAEQILAELKVTYASLHHLLESLGGLEGRKVLLYVGDGVAAQPGTDSYGLIEEMCGNANNRVMLGHPLDGTAPMHQVVATANANLVTLYTLEAAGLRSYARADTGRPIMSADLSQRVSFDRQDSLTTLAKDTGGRAALNANDFSRDLAQIAADINGSYSLGFTPEHAGDGRIHSLKVEVTRPGLTAAYRASYRDRSVQERLEGQVEAALIHGMADNPLAASVKLGTATPSEHGRVTLPIQVRVPFGRLTYLPQPDGRHGRVSIVVGNIDAKGGMSPIRRVQLPLRIPEADAKRVLASNLGYDVKLVLEPGRQRLAFAVRDDIGRVTAAVIQEIDVDKKGTAVAVAQTGGGG